MGRDVLTMLLNAIVRHFTPPSTIRIVKILLDLFYNFIGHHYDCYYRIRIPIKLLDASSLCRCLLLIFFIFSIFSSFLQSQYILLSSQRGTSSSAKWLAALLRVFRRILRRGFKTPPQHKKSYGKDCVLRAKLKV